MYRTSEEQEANQHPEYSLEKAIQQKRFKDAWQKAAINIIYTGSWLKNETTEFLRPFGLTAQQYNVLRILRGQHPNGITTMEIRKRLLDKMSDTSRMVDRLERNGWVEKKRDNFDKRLVSVNISDKGLKVLTEIDELENNMHRLIRNLSESDARTLSDLLDKVRAGVNQKL